ncbi:unnamed protein product [Lepeophtheirus salmonis]|uniref:(salmon louse) hypothetical protein n=1 Tax=Lepeophtheirus salmonis TaxID=72036 RepID=A0A7R8CI72_LEPSM|nr:unnamed protein product [Lepeophtheirus salmonis]CAF2792924.1 unnamed protein product [Lepeophtheirus salmonis]
MPVGHAIARKDEESGINVPSRKKGKNAADKISQSYNGYGRYDTIQCVKMNVKIGKTKNTTNQWLYFNAFINMTTEPNLSVRKTIKSGSLLRSGSNTKSHELDSFFEAKILIFDAKDVDEDDSGSVFSSKKNASNYRKIGKWCVFCNDLPNFIEYVIEKRECKKPMLKFVHGWWPGTILDQLNISATHFLACEFKLLNILLGLQNHAAATYPCYWCEAAKKPLTYEKAPLRSLGNIKANYNDFEYVGKEDLKVARDFNNFIHEPPIGQTNHDFDSIKDTLTSNKAFKWAFENGIVREGYHGGQLNDPNFILLLFKLETLEQIVPKDLFDHIDTLRLFKKLRQGGVLQFIDRYQEPLGFYSERAVEYLHSDFKDSWMEYTRKSNHRDYADQLGKTVVHYNSYHIRK